MGLVGLAFIALNALLQWVPIRVSEYIKWGVRFVVVTAVATSWAQFQPIYEIITNTPGAIGAELMGATMAPNLNVAFDLMISELFAFSDKLADESGFFTISMTSVVVWIIGGLMAVAAIIISSLAKVGLAMAVSLAPVFIPTLMFKATGNLFESWVRFTLGFALIPLVLAGVMGAIIGIGSNMTTDAANATELSGAAGFIIVGVSAIFLMIQVPTLVNGLAGTIVATANGVAMAAGRCRRRCLGGGRRDQVRRAARRGGDVGGRRRPRRERHGAVREPRDDCGPPGLLRGAETLRNEARPPFGGARRAGGRIRPLRRRQCRTAGPGARERRHPRHATG